MELKKEFNQTVRNSLNMIQYIELIYEYNDLEQPIVLIVYPHEFDTLEDFKNLESQHKTKSEELAKELYFKQEFNKNQLNFFN